MPRLGGYGDDEDDFSLVEKVFGAQTKVVWAVFIEQIINSECKFIFSATAIRQKLFEIAEVQMKHYA